MRDRFEQLAAEVCVPDCGADRVTLYLTAEESDFIRFNRGAVRQATHVDQAEATIAVVRGTRRIESTMTLVGRLDSDLAALRAERDLLIAQLDDVPEDPYLLLPADTRGSERIETGSLPSADTLVRAVCEASRGLDFVGFYAGGPVVRAFADSRGQRHWHQVETFHFDWCLYQHADKAIKTTYAGTRWDDAEFARRVAEAAGRLPLLARPARRLDPGAYRAYFTPCAMGELLGALSWGGFGARDRHTGTSTLARLAQGEVLLSPAMNLAEDTGRGLSPAFTADGLAKPACVKLVDAGKASGTLNSPRSARQYGLEANGADDQEMPQALRLAPGGLAASEVLRCLDRGLYVSNLWYLNYSDRQACRLTGMTRFACFWVEDARIVEPLDVMRFDDSFLRMFGEGLVALTDEAQLLPDAETYQLRHLASITTPGAVVDGWRLTL